MEPISIVIPVYNEGENIAENLTRMKREVQVPYEIDIVYDFDEDNTLPVAKKVRDELALPIRFVKNQYGRGALNAIKTGLQEANNELIVVTMADLSDPPRVINDMVQFLHQEQLDLVCASRYMQGGSQTGGPFFKSMLSRLAGTSLFCLTSLPTSDPTNSFKLYTKRVVDTFHIESTGGFELGIELVVKAHFAGFRIGQVPTQWTDRSAGESQFKLFSWLPLYLHWYTYALKKQYF